MKNKNKGNQLFNLLSLRQKDFESPNKNIYSASVKNFINNKNKSQQNIMFSEKKKKENKNNSCEKDNNQINIRLNINSEIINNNFSNTKNENNKYEDLIKEKNMIIASLEKELIEVKEKINKNQNKRKRINSVDDINYKNKKTKNKNNRNKEINKIQNLKPSNIISKNVKQFFQNLIIKKDSKENINSKNIISNKNLILNTSNYNNYINNNKKNLYKNLYSDPTRETEITEFEKNNLLTQTKKNSSLFKSNSFLFTSQNLKKKKKKLDKRRCQSQIENNYSNFNYINTNHFQKKNHEIFFQLNKLKVRTQDLLSNFLYLCNEK